MIEFLVGTILQLLACGALGYSIGFRRGVERGRVRPGAKS